VIDSKDIVHCKILEIKGFYNKYYSAYMYNMMQMNVLIIICMTAFLSTVFISDYWQTALASTDENILEISVYHKGSGEAEICLKNNNDYEDICDNFDLGKYRNPFVYEITIENPKRGETFDICYEDKNSNQDGCKEYEIKGRSIETVDLVLPGASTSSSSLPSINNNEFQSSSTPSAQSQSSLSNQNQQEQLNEASWKTFKDRNGFFTVQHPSNWLPSYPPEPIGPIDISLYFGNSQGDAYLSIFKFEGLSTYLTSSESIESSISYEQSASNNFRLIEPTECTKYHINGVSACSYTASFTDVDGIDQTYMFVRAVTPEGIEYGANYMSSPNLFNHFKPTIDHMIESFSVIKNPGPLEDLTMGNMTG
jgi:hypothetical protein